MPDRPTDIELLRSAYAAFNARDINAALTFMSQDVTWPKAFKGGFVQGPEEIRAYWTEQWSEIDPHVEPVAFHPEDDSVLVEVLQVVRDLTGTILADDRVGHRFRIGNGLIQGMEVCPVPNSLEDGMESDDRAIREVHDAWIKSANAIERDRLLPMTTDDVVFLIPGQQAIDKDGFAAKFSGAHEQLLIHCVSELKEVVVVGEVAYTLSWDTLSVSPRAGVEESRLAGDHLTIYRKQADGRWLLARDANVLSLVEELGS